VHDYNTVITSVHDDISTQIDSLTMNRDNLLNLENDLYKQFFAQANPGVDNSNFDSLEGLYQNKINASHALAQKINSSFGPKDNFSSTDYMTKLKDLLSQVSWTSSDYNTLFTAMAQAGVDSSSYQKDLELIAGFGNVLPGATAGQVDFSDAPASKQTEQTFIKTLKIKVPAGQIYKLSPTQADNVQIVYDDTSSNVDRSEASILNDGNNNLQLYNKDHEVTKPDGTTTVTPNTTDATFTLVYNISLGQTTTATVTFGWGTSSTNKNSSSESYSLYPSNEISEYLGGNKFGIIAQLLNTIDKAATLITWVYGAPNDSVANVLNRLPRPATLDDFKHLAPNSDSIYALYGNMNLSQLEARLSNQDVKDFQTQGHDAIEKVIASIRDLNASIEVLNKDKEALASNLPDDVFNQKIKDLQNWYSTTMTSINQQYESWKKNDTHTLALKSWQDYNPKESVLYQDQAASAALYKTVSELSTSTAKSAEDTSKSAQMIKDNATQFNQMVTSTKETKASAEQLLKNTDHLLNTGNSSLKDSKDYNANFGKVLANTRNQNANKNQLFDFFAQPLGIKNMTGVLASMTKGFDWRWVIILVVGILLGILGTLLSRLFLIRKQKNE
jgi:methyl-accepting chemotaxis protein